MAKLGLFGTRPVSRWWISLAALYTGSVAYAAACELGSEALCGAQARYEQADTRLNETYQAILNKIQANAYEDYGVDKSALQRRLLTSQQDWQTYRDSDCEAYYTLFSGGTSRDVDRLVCLTDSSLQRAKWLRSLYM